MEALIGITTSDLMRLFKENNFSIDKKYRGRARQLFIMSLFNSRGKKREQKRFADAIATAQVKKPVFILGHWRSGTTLLHTLLTMDDQFAYPNLFQVSKPHQCLSMEKKVEQHLARVKAEKRAMDNMAVTFRDPGEDESALSVLCQRSPLISWTFPRNREKYDKYHTFKGVNEEDVNEWKKALLYFYKKITLRYNKPLILKSPVHTARVKILNEIFPDAKFIHISRDPYAIFRSTKRLYNKMLPLTCLQEPDFGEWDNYIMENYQTIYNAYFEDIEAIPKERKYELKFENLENDMSNEIEKIYKHLNFTGFEKIKPELHNYIEQNKDFQKNSHSKLETDIKAQIDEKWDIGFQKFNYSKT